MIFLTPLALTLALLAIPILLLYLLKLRRRPVVVSSNLLWEQLLRDRQANTPWQRFKRNLLLLLQLLILGSLVIALSRPAVPMPAISTGSIIVLLDASASMNATDVAPSRFEAAKAYTHDLINHLNKQDRMTLIVVGEQPVVLASGESDKTHLHSMLDTAIASQGNGAWESAFALVVGAQSASSQQAGPPATTIILSDGGVPPDLLPSMPGTIRYVSIGLTDDNLAISALSVRSTGRDVELFTKISNFSSANRTVLLSIYADGNLIHAQEVLIPNHSYTPLTLTGLSGTPAAYLARISLSDPAEGSLDALSLDDQAYTVYMPASTGRALLVTPGNIFLEQVLGILPNITSFQLNPDDLHNLSLPPDNFDLYVFDGVYPLNQELPPGNLLLVNPPSNPLFPVLSSYAVTGTLRFSNHPILDDLYPGGIHIAHASKIDLPPWAEELIFTDQGPLLFTGQTLGRRIAVLTFDLHQSDLPLQVAFPILIARLTDYLLPSQTPLAFGSIQPGSCLSILPPAEVERVSVVTPSGISYGMTPTGGDLLITQTNEIGLYAVNYFTGNHAITNHFSVNLFSSLESDIQPQSVILIGNSPVSASMQEELAHRELWTGIAAFGLAILIVEWWVYHGRLRLPNSHLSQG